MLLPDDQILHVGDRVRIVCPEAPEICVERSVGADGTIDLPGIGALPAAVRRIGELSRQIAERIPESLYPATVEIRWIGPARGVVSVEGAVKNPLRLFAPNGISSARLWEAAGLLDEADTTFLGSPRRVPAGTSLSVPIVTVERRISIVGAVNAPRALPPSDGLTLNMGIEAAGGVSPHGNADAITIERFGELFPVQLSLDGGFRLLPGDTVRIGLAEDRHYVIVRGLVGRPGAVEYARGMTATRAFTAAGGLTDKGKRGTLVWQTGAKTFRLSIAYIFAGRIPDPVLNAEDTITVEAAKS